MIVEGREYRFTMFNSSPRIVACGGASHFSVNMLQDPVTQLAFRLYTMERQLNLSRKVFYPCNDRGQSKELFCLVQAKGDTVFGNPILFRTPLLYLKVSCQLSTNFCTLDCNSVIERRMNFILKAMDSRTIRCLAEPSKL